MREPPSNPYAAAQAASLRSMAPFLEDLRSRFGDGVVTHINRQADELERQAEIARQLGERL